MNIHSQLRNNLIAALACVLWSTAFVGVKVGLDYAKPLGFAGLRFMLSGLMILPFCGSLSKLFGEIRRHWRLMSVVAFFQTALLYGLFFVGMTFVSGATGAIVVGASPLFAAIVAHLLQPHDKMTLFRTISIFIGIAGIVFISVNRYAWSAGDWKETLGILLLMLGSISSAVANVLVAKDREDIHPVMLNGVQIFLGGLLLFLLSIPVEGIPICNFPLRFYLAFGWLSFLSAVSFSLWFMVLKQPNVKVSEINIWKFIIPVFGAVLSWILLPGESPEIGSLIGMVCVALSILTFYSQSFRRKVPNR